MYINQNKNFMKKLLLLINVFGMSVSYSQSNCGNLDFEDGDFSNWILTTGSSCDTSFRCYSNPAIGTNSTDPIDMQRHVLFDTVGYDLDVPVSILCPFTGSFSTRLGNYYAGMGAEEMFTQVQLGYYDTVIKFHYAYINNDPGGHAPRENPFFLVEVLDSLGGALTTPINFSIIGHDSSFNTVGFPYFAYKNWSTINLDVSSVRGREVRLRVLNSDCNSGAHEGRVYFDVECSNNTTTVEKENNTLDFNIYPNPSNGITQLNINEDGKIYTYTINGKLLNVFSIYKGFNQLDFNDYNEGIYFVKYLTYKGEYTTTKIQIIK